MFLVWKISWKGNNNTRIEEDANIVLESSRVKWVQPCLGTPGSTSNNIVRDKWNIEKCVWRRIFKEKKSAYLNPVLPEGGYCFICSYRLRKDLTKWQLDIRTCSSNPSKRLWSQLGCMWKQKSMYTKRVHSLCIDRITVKTSVEMSKRDVFKGFRKTYKLQRWVFCTKRKVLSSWRLRE